MAKKKPEVPKYGTITLKGIQYYRTRIMDADGKQVSLYATTCEELYEKELEARRQVEEIIFHRQHPTVAEYCEKWLLMQSAKVSASTLRGYRHSKWLSFMQKRLKLAKKLLNPRDSVLIVTIDEKEYLHLGCLLEEMFPEGRMQMVSSVINPAGAGRQAEFSRTDEYIFFVQLGDSSI